MTFPRNLLLGAAILATVGLALLAGSRATAAVVTAGLATWLLTPGLWSAAALVNSDWRRLGISAATTIAVAGLVSNWLIGAVLGSLTLAGLVAAWATLHRWRVLPLLAVTMLALIPSMALPLAGVSFTEAVTEQVGIMHEWYVEQLPADISASDRSAALAAFEDASKSYLALVDRFWPSLVMAWLASQTALFMGLGWNLARVVDRRVPRPVMTPLATWRAPFASVWVLIGGLMLSLAGGGLVALVGWNLVVVAATLLVCQGFGVQVWLVRRVMSPLGQTIYWVLGALFFSPVLIGVGALFGLADQWLDMRRLRRPPVDKDKDET